MDTIEFNYLEILKQHILAGGYPLLLDLERSKGTTLFDKATGEKYLDMMSFYASMPLGMNPDFMLTSEVKNDLLIASTNKISNSDFYTDQFVRFVDVFTSKMVPKNFPYLFLISGGTLAVENALKAAFDWKARKTGGNENTKVIHFKEAFHGRSGYTLSLTNTADPRKYLYFPKFDWPRVTNPKISFPLNEQNQELVENLEKKSLQEIHSAIETSQDPISSIIIEPIQGEGGDNHFRPEFLRKLREVADQNEIMLIYDEVQTGMGLTGKRWAFEYDEKSTPDLVAFGKKAQVCGIFSTKRIDEVDKNVFHEESRINSTWGGNLVDMVRSTHYIEHIMANKIIENVNKKGEVLKKALLDMENDHSTQVSNVRNKGLMAAFDLGSTELRNKVVNQALKEKLLILKSGVNSIRFRPILNVENDDLLKAVSILDSILHKI